MSEYPIGNPTDCPEQRRKTIAGMIRHSNFEMHLAKKLGNGCLFSFEFPAIIISYVVNRDSIFVTQNGLNDGNQDDAFFKLSDVLLWDEESVLEYNTDTQHLFWSDHADLAQNTSLRENTITENIPSLTEHTEDMDLTFRTSVFVLMTIFHV